MSMSATSLHLLHRLWGLRRPRRLASVILRRLGIAPAFTVRGVEIKLHLHDATWARHLWENPHRFDDDVRLLQSLCDPGSTVIDCGANIGFLSLVASRAVGPTGRVIAIEADAMSVTRARANLALNKAENVELRHAAVGMESGVAHFAAHGADEARHVMLEQGQGEQVVLITLDQVVPGGCSVALVKIDVEGFEWFVLRGASRVLSSTKFVLFECSDTLTARYGYPAERCMELLRGAGFTVFVFDDGGELRPAPSPYHETRIVNCIAARDPLELQRRLGRTVKEGACRA